MSQFVRDPSGGFVLGDYQLFFDKARAAVVSQHKTDVLPQFANLVDGATPDIGPLLNALKLPLSARMRMMSYRRVGEEYE